MRPLWFRVRGMAPGVLMNNPESYGVVPGVDDDSETTTAKGRTYDPEIEAAIKAYRVDGDGSQLYLPLNMFRASILVASVGRRHTPSKMSLKGIISGTLFMQEDRALLINPDSGEPVTSYEIDKRRAVVQKAGVIKSRPLVYPWAANLAFEYDHDLINAGVIEETITRAGTVVGVGDYRPAKTGWFGKFEVLEMMENEA